MTQETEVKPIKRNPASRITQAILAFGFAVAALAATGWAGSSEEAWPLPAHEKELVVASAVSHGDTLSEEDLFCVDEPPFADPLPVTEYAPPEPMFPKAEHLKLIGRLSEGIIKIKGKRDLGQWWECGELYDSEKAKQDAALEWAYRLVYLSWEYTDRGSDDGRVINPWGVAGVAYNESGFDRCALGTWPRKWAYDTGRIKRRKRSISHSKDEIIAAMSSEDAIALWRKTGIDAAPLHELWRCGADGCRPKYNPSLPAIGFGELFSLGKGFDYNVRQMKKRADHYDTDRPWLYWRGYRCEWYDEKITRWARMMGAGREEI